jgi:hypothetical protein
MIQRILTPIVLFAGLLWVLLTKEGEEYINNYQNDDINGTDFCF